MRVEQQLHLTQAFNSSAGRSVKQSLVRRPFTNLRRRTVDPPRQMGFGFMKTDGFGHVGGLVT